MFIIKGVLDIEDVKQKLDIWEIVFGGYILIQIMFYDEYGVQFEVIVFIVIFDNDFYVGQICDYFYDDVEYISIQVVGV